MREDGTLVICDRCNKKYFVSLKRQRASGRLTYLDLLKWGRREGYDLCPKCYNEYKELFDDFLSKAETISDDDSIQIQERGE